PRRWNELLGDDGLTRWRRDGKVDVYHHSVDAEVPLNYGFIEDARRYETENLSVDVPCLVFHGEGDETVPVEESVLFAENNSEFVELYVLKDDHQLIGSLDTIWTITSDFLVRQGVIGGVPEWEETR